MDNSSSKDLWFLKRVKRFSKWTRRVAFIILAALMLGFTNAFYDEK